MNMEGKRFPGRLLPGILVLFFLFLGLSLTGCRSEETAEAHIVRGGLSLKVRNPVHVRVASGEGTVLDMDFDKEKQAAFRLGPDLWLLELSWKPGERFDVDVQTSDFKKRLSVTAPQKPSPLRVEALELENVPPYSGKMGGNPDTTVKFSPDGRFLAVGSFKGYLRVLDVLTGQVVFEKKIAEGMVKRLAWGELDGQSVLFLGEQSPDGCIYCLDARDGREIWRYSLSVDIGATTAGSEENRFGIYCYPGVYGLTRLPDGDLLAVGCRGYFKGDDFLYKCRLLRLEGETGRVKWKWPEDRSLPYDISWFGASKSGDRLVLLTSSLTPPKEQDPVFQNGTLYFFDGKTGRASLNYEVPPLEPYYKRAGTWQGVTMSPDGARAALSLYDGRVFFFSLENMNWSSSGEMLKIQPSWVRTPGAPTLVGGIPVASQASYALLSDQNLFVLLSSTSVPTSLTKDKSQAPAPHPFYGYLMVYDFQGQVAWQWKAPASPQGLCISEDEQWLAVGISQSRGLDDVNDFGLALFDLKPQTPAQDRFVFQYPTEGPAFFDLDMTSDGRLAAFTEMPFSLDEGKTVYGRYQVQVIH